MRIVRPSFEVKAGLNSPMRCAGRIDGEWRSFSSSADIE
jgi:hypothetical protein